MRTIHIGGDESVKITFPDGDDWDGDDMIAVVVEGEQVGAWSIVEDPQVEAEACARSYSEVYDVAWANSRRDGRKAGFDDGVRYAIGVFCDELAGGVDKAKERLDEKRTKT